MKKTGVLLLCLLFMADASADLLRYRFVGGPADPHIDFTLGVDFSRVGYAINSTGSIIEISDSFYVTYVSGNYSLAPTSYQFQRFYGATDGPTVEGDVYSCMNALNSIDVCDETSPLGWSVGMSLAHSAWDYIDYDVATVTLVSISQVPLPASVLLFITGLTVLFPFRKKCSKVI